MFFQRRQMPRAHDVACADDPDAQFVIIFLRHTSMPFSILRRAPRITRAKFDQRGAFIVQLRKRSRVKIRLTRAIRHSSLRDLFAFSRSPKFASSQDQELPADAS